MSGEFLMCPITGSKKVTMLDRAEAFTEGIELLQFALQGPLFKAKLMAAFKEAMKNPATDLPLPKKRKGK